MNRPTLPRGRREVEVKIVDRYQDSYKRYVSSQFTFNSNCLLKKLCENGQKQPKMQGVPLYQILIQICKIMMMNQLELLFFGATVQDMGWKVIQNCLTPYIEQVTDITPNNTQKDIYVKKMQLSLLLIAYIVKIYLNQDSAMYDFKIRDLVKNNFDKMYQQWVTKVQNNFKFSPKHMNRLFKQLDKGKCKQNNNIVDYNNLVNELFKDSFGQEKSAYYQKSFNSPEQRFYDRSRLKDQEALVESVPIQEDEYADYRLPAFPDRGISGRSQMSALGFGKKESYHQLFQKGQIKPENNHLISNFSQDQDFLGNQ